MQISVEQWAEALKVNQEITEEEEEKATKLIEKYPFIASRNSAYEAILRRRVLDRITELVEKVDEYNG